jgi:hypothetical protein
MKISHEKQKSLRQTVESPFGRAGRWMQEIRAFRIFHVFFVVGGKKREGSLSRCPLAAQSLDVVGPVQESSGARSKSGL